MEFKPGDKVYCSCGSTKYCGRDKPITLKEKDKDGYWYIIETYNYYKEETLHKIKITDISQMRF